MFSISDIGIHRTRFEFHKAFDTLGSFEQWYFFARGFNIGAQFRFDGLFQFYRIDFYKFEGINGFSFAITQNAKQQMLGTYVIIPQTFGFLCTVLQNCL